MEMFALNEAHKTDTSKTSFFPVFFNHRCRVAGSVATTARPLVETLGLRNQFPYACDVKPPFLYLPLSFLLLSFLFYFGFNEAVFPRLHTHSSSSSCCCRSVLPLFPFSCCCRRRRSSTAVVGDGGSSGG